MKFRSMIRGTVALGAVATTAVALTACGAGDPNAGDGDRITIGVTVWVPQVFQLERQLAESSGGHLPE